MSKRKIKIRPAPLHMLGTKSRKMAYRKALASIAEKFERKEYVTLEPVSIEIGKQLCDFVEEAAKRTETLGDANKEIMAKLFDMVSKEQFEIKQVEYLVIPNGAVKSNGETMPIDPHGDEAKELRKILRLHV